MENGSAFMHSSSAWPLPFIIAHRGASAIAPENTIPSLEIAHQKGATGVECDVRLTADGQAVIFHDSTLERTTNGSGYLSQQTLSQLTTWDAGSWFSPHFKNTRIPTLAEWLTACVRYHVSFNLEIKTQSKKQSDDLIAIINKHIAQHWHADLSQLLISSTNGYCLAGMANANPAIPLGLVSDKKLSQRQLQNFPAFLLSVHHPFSIVDAKYIALLHEKKIKVLAYTVNDLVILKKLIDDGIDGVFTDNETWYGM